jgi:ankyrin repeat protein
MDIPQFNEPRFQFWHSVEYEYRDDLQKILETSLEYIESVNFRGQTALEYIVSSDPDSFDRMDILRLLITHKANLSPRDLLGRTPLHHAVKTNDIPVIQILIANGADINAMDNVDEGGTPLHYSVLDNNTVIPTLLLLQAGADVSAIRPYDGNRPLHDAAANNNTAALVLLVQYGAQLEETNHIEHMTALMVAVLNHEIAPMLVLLHMGADVNTLCDGESSLLHQAVYANHHEMVRILIENGVPLDLIDSYGDTAEQVAEQMDYTVEAVIIREAINLKLQKQQARREAFAMGQHKRLGEESHVHSLSEEGMRMVVEYM